MARSGRRWSARSSRFRPRAASALTATTAIHSRLARADATTITTARRRGRGGCRHRPGHQDVMLSPPRDLDLCAAGRELDDDRFIAQPLQAVGVRGMLPAKTVDWYQFIADHERCLGPDEDIANPAAGTAHPFPAQAVDVAAGLPDRSGEFSRLPEQESLAHRHMCGHRSGGAIRHTDHPVRARQRRPLRATGCRLNWATCIGPD